MTTANNQHSIKQTIESILKEHSTLDFKDGRFTSEVYIEHDATLPKEELKKISSADVKKIAFYAALEEYAQESTLHTENEVLRIIEENWPKDATSSYDDSYDDILGQLAECVDFEFPFDHFLEQEILVNFIIDTGDGNYDYTLNNFLSYNADRSEKIGDESALLWLAKQQGYKKSELNRLVRKGETQDSKFLTSLYTEGENVTTHMNALTFFVKMTVEDFINFHDTGKSITFSKDTPCGLYDPWNGAGGPLEIELEKDVVVPAKIAQAHIEGVRGYGVESIYGMSSSFWKDTVLNIKTA